MEKIVSQLTADGFFHSAVTADESPLEPGVFLIPGGAIDVEPPSAVRDGMRYVPAEGGGWLESPVPEHALSREQLSSIARSDRDVLLGVAALRIAPLEDAVDLGIASADETDALAQWKAYRVALMRIEQQPGFPETIDWPAVPQQDH
ncbi:hypothetical protein CEG14_05780 [Bordetella genomosp. 1]|uniref:Phage tail protein n=1 Tax=Bordetella genomosp. 1 TaxID=1395607 RepID=A0A261SNT8_9BORD|nr:tail fiber assembly protein [Bordetella genomosp. 1]OZI39044.1 hypothetical protein CEG14_05780 [Bordetella genomosp. 1]